MFMIITECFADSAACDSSFNLLVGGDTIFMLGQLDLLDPCHKLFATSC